MRSLPINDWQFWAATVIALVALRHVLKMIFPAGLPLTKKRRQGKGTRATLTVDRKPVEKTRS